MAKIEPAVTQLLYQVPDGASYIDLAKDLSKVNRRLYRQGMTYVVQDIQVGVSSGMRATDVQSLSFSTAGNSWIVHNAWKKGFAAWRKQQNDVKRELGDIAGKWEDFKIYLDDSMRGGTTLEPYAGDGAVYLAGEWVYSQYVWDDEGTERETYGHLIGSSTGTTDFGLIEEYGISRRTVQAEDPVTDADASTSMYAKMLNFAPDALMADMIDNMENSNDSPPYDFDDYPGGAANADVPVPVRFGSLSGTQTTTTMAGFIVPCGLIQVYNSELELTNTTESATDLGDVGGTGVASPGPLSVYAARSAQTAYVIVTVAPGPYRGVLAAPMGQ